MIYVQQLNKRVNAYNAIPMTGFEELISLTGGLFAGATDVESAPANEVAPVSAGSTTATIASAAKRHVHASFKW